MKKYVPIVCLTVLYILKLVLTILIKQFGTHREGSFETILNATKTSVLHTTTLSRWISDNSILFYGLIALSVLSIIISLIGIAKALKSSVFSILVYLFIILLEILFIYSTIHINSNVLSYIFVFVFAIFVGQIDLSIYILYNLSIFILLILLFKSYYKKNRYSLN